MISLAFEPFDVRGALGMKLGDFFGGGHELDYERAWSEFQAVLRKGRRPSTGDWLSGAARCDPWSSERSESLLMEFFASHRTRDSYDARLESTKLMFSSIESSSDVATGLQQRDPETIKGLLNCQRRSKS